jgi:hypothetical protein
MAIDFRRRKTHANFHPPQRLVAPRFLVQQIGFGKNMAGAAIEFSQGAAGRVGVCRGGRSDGFGVRGARVRLRLAAGEKPRNDQDRQKGAAMTAPVWILGHVLFISQDTSIRKSKTRKSPELRRSNPGKKKPGRSPVL